MKPKELRLKIELVPSTSWYDNLRKYTTREDWDKIRKAAYQTAPKPIYIVQILHFATIRQLLTKIKCFLPRKDKKYKICTHTSSYGTVCYANYGYKCGICGAEGRLNCHEIWEYDDKKHIQKLSGFVALCDMCHHVKHIGLAGILASKGKLDYEKVVEHFMKVNNCDRDAFEKHREKAFEHWRKRSSHEWQVDLGEYEDIIQVTSKKR